MATVSDKLKLIFGLKIKQLRLEKGLSLSDLARKINFSISYLNEIEKGKKYPKADKIFQLSYALDVDYDSLVSLKMNKHLEPIAELLDSDILTQLPLEIFGIEPTDFLDLMSSAPTKLSAFISTVSEISRHLDFNIQKFYLAVMRSYQEMYDNYFPDIEADAMRFLAEFQAEIQYAEPYISGKFLEKILIEKYGYSIENYDQNTYPSLMSLRSVYIPEQNKLLINQGLSPEQRAFTMGRELGYQFMNIKNRPLMSSAFEASSFELVFNNFKASYFAGALLINRQLLINDLEVLFAQSSWQDQFFQKIMAKFNTTPERFLLRMTHVLPSHFGIQQLFFLRFNQIEGIDFFAIEKEMHLARQHSPHGTALREHYCRRWSAVSILKELEQTQNKAEKENKILVKTQISSYLDTNNKYFLISVAKPSPPVSGRNSSVNLGLVIDESLRKKLKFLDNDTIIQKEVNHTCERCRLDNCQDRAAKPRIWEDNQHQKDLKNTLLSLGIKV